MQLLERLGGLFKKEKKSAPANPELVSSYQQLVQKAMGRIRHDGINEQESMRAVYLRAGATVARFLDADTRGHLPNEVGLYIDVLLDGKSFHSGILPRNKSFVTGRTHGLGTDQELLSRILTTIEAGEVIGSRAYYDARAKAKA